jgi:hypothetical protein
MMRYRDHYDWIVLGDNPGALLSAGLASRLGLSVLVLPLVPSSHRIISASGQCMDPEANHIPGLGQIGEERGIVRDCLIHLGLDRNSPHIRMAENGFQVVTPEHRINLPLDLEALRVELGRELGDAGSSELGLFRALSHAEPAIWKYWRNYPERFVVTPERGKGREPVSTHALFRSLQKTFKTAFKGEVAWFDSKQKVSALAGMATLGTGWWHASLASLNSEPSLPDLLNALALGRLGASVNGGLSAYRDLLRGLARKLGAHVPGDVQCQRVFIEEGAFRGVQLSGESTMLTGTGAILGSALDQAAEKLSNTQSRSSRLKKSPAARAWRFTLALTVYREAIPPGLWERTIWSEDGAPPIEIEVTDPESYGIDEPEHRLVFLRTPLPFDRESLSVSYQRMIAARMMRQLCEMVPFLEFQVVRIYPDFRSDGGEFSEVYGFASPEMIPENLRSYEAGSGIGSRTGIEGLFVATNESFPELGAFGPTLAAIEATAWIAHKSGLAGPLNTH